MDPIVTTLNDQLDQLLQGVRKEQEDSINEVEKEYMTPKQCQYCGAAPWEEHTNFKDNNGVVHQCPNGFRP